MRSLMRPASARSSPRTARNSADCRSGITLPLPESRPLQPSTSELRSQALWVESTLTGRGRLCSVRTCHSCCCRLPHQSLMARMFGISSHIRSSVSGGYPWPLAIGYWKTMIGRSLASAMREKCASAICGDCPSVNGPGGNTSSAAAQPVECARGAFGGMRVDGDGRDAVGRRDLAQMLAQGRLVDGEIVVEGQQHCRNDAVREVGTGHGLPSSLVEAVSAS